MGQILRKRKGSPRPRHLWKPAIHKHIWSTSQESRAEARRKTGKASYLSRTTWVASSAPNTYLTPIRTTFRWTQLRELGKWLDRTPMITRSTPSIAKSRFCLPARSSMLDLSLDRPLIRPIQIPSLWTQAWQIWTTAQIILRLGYVKTLSNQVGNASHQAWQSSRRLCSKSKEKMLVATSKVPASCRGSLSDPMGRKSRRMMWKLYLLNLWLSNSSLH